ncbi:MAG: hypothetical protein OXR84_11890, partial [Magnetovibrio sp.]|nr:hypothetical protein [Magnetovibrio sp.]
NITYPRAAFQRDRKENVKNNLLDNFRPAPPRPNFRRAATKNAALRWNAAPHGRAEGTLD